LVKLIILGAGEGKRLLPLTQNIPKCMVKIFEKPLLEHQIDIIRKCGITEIVIVKGYCEEMIKIPDVRYYKNEKYNSTNMVETLFCAEKELDGPVIISYGDILYEKNVLEKLLASKDDFSIIIDKNWQEYWEIRFQNILDDVESLTLENGFITNLGQKTDSLNDIQGQYIGLMKFQNNAISVLKNFYHISKKQSESGSNPLNSKVSFENSYMTDLLQGLINHNHKLKAIEINGGWLELDTLHDFEIYKNLYKNNTLKKFLNLEND
jgi:choline kinase